jgi:hypothetical protein
VAYNEGAWRRGADMKQFPLELLGSLHWRLAVPAGVAIGLLAVGIALGAYFASGGSDGANPPSNVKFIPGPSELWTAVDYAEDGWPIVAHELIVKFRDGVPEEEREAILREAGAQTKKIREFSRTRVVKVDPAQREQILKELSSNENIEIVERNLILQADTPQ